MMLTQRYVRAFDYAMQAHALQTRKGTAVPYLAHLVGVSSLVLDYGGDEDQAIAGLLHDVVEDHGQHHLTQIRDRFGHHVAQIVLDCTDGTQEEKNAALSAEEKRANWELRKQRYLAHLNEVSETSLLVSACDKLHNARAILTDLRSPLTGEHVFDRFTAGKAGTLWYYTRLSEVFAARGSPVALELGLTIKALSSQV